MYDTGITISQIRREIKAIKRKYAREIAAAVLSPVVDQIVELWNIALAKKLPKPDPLSCIRKVVKAGFRLQTFKALHGYLEDCRYYNYFPDPEVITAKVFPPGRKVELAAVLPGMSRASTKHTSGAEQKCTTREVIGQRKCPRQLFGRSVTEAGWQQAGRVSE